MELRIYRLVKQKAEPAPGGEREREIWCWSIWSHERHKGEQWVSVHCLHFSGTRGTFHLAFLHHCLIQNIRKERKNMGEKNPRRVDLIYNFYTPVSSKFHNRATGLVNNEFFNMWKLHFLSSFKCLWKSDLFVGAYGIQIRDFRKCREYEDLIH